MSTPMSREAGALYVRATQLRATSRTRHTREVMELCRRAVALELNFARAWAQIAVCEMLLGFDAAPGEDGAAAADKALSLDPNLGEAHAVKGRVLVGQGRLVEAKGEIERAVQLDPGSYDVNAAAARYSIAAKKFGEALQHLVKAAALVETDVWALGMALQCYEARNDSAGTRTGAQQSMERINKVLAADAKHEDALAFGVTTLLRLGQSVRALEWAERALKLNPEGRNLRYNMACAMCQLAKFDRAIELLEPVAQVCGRQGIEWLKVDTDLDPIRKSPRFKAMLEQAETRLRPTPAP